MIPIRRTWVPKLALAAVVACTVFSSRVGPASAASFVSWLGSYAESPEEPCTWVTALWSDGTSSATPWACDAGQVATRSDGVKSAGSYAQIAANGCTEFVTKWLDNSLSWVPYVCPDGVEYLKSQSLGVQPMTHGAKAGSAAPDSVTPRPPLSGTVPVPPADQRGPALPAERLDRWGTGKRGVNPE